VTALQIAERTAGAVGVAQHRAHQVPQPSSVASVQYPTNILWKESAYLCESNGSDSFDFTARLIFTVARAGNLQGGGTRAEFGGSRSPAPLTLHFRVCLIWSSAISRLTILSPYSVSIQARESSSKTTIPWTSSSATAADSLINWCRSQL
jgi:hypothetical protein